MTKICSKCGEKKQLESFRKRSEKEMSKYKSELSKHLSWCRKCEKYYQLHEAPGRFWTHLSHNLKRHGKGNLSGSELKKHLGEPSLCHICGSIIRSSEKAELDHFKPLIKGGLSEINNLKWAHKTCNRMKHDLLMSDMLILIKKILVYHNI